MIYGCSSSDQPLPKDREIVSQTVEENETMPIVLIGPSTVYISHELKEGVKENPKVVKKENLTDCRLEGWGEELYNYTKSEVYNFAHPGANSSTFMKSPQQVENECNKESEDRKRRNCLQELKNFGPKRDHYWGGAKEKMRELGRGFLLIQFGANEKRRDESRFKSNIKTYIKEARELGFTPILITEIEKRVREANGALKHSRGDYPKWMREVGEEEGVRVLDLNTKSYQEYSKYSDDEWNEKFANCYNRWSGHKQNTHFEPHGARIVAGWIRDLACEEGYEDSKLCKQFYK
jgi:hypothetical protein